MGHFVRIPELERHAGPFRYEQKAAGPASGLDRLLWQLSVHRGAFTAAYPARRINNVYLDTPERHHLQAALCGNAERLKLRVRWYGALEGRAAKPQLEVKYKRNDMGAKLRFALPDFDFDRGLSASDLRGALSAIECSTPLRELIMSSEPVLVNSYRRIYRRSFDRRFMVTVDTAVESQRVSPGGAVLRREPPDHDRMVVELKYDAQDRDRRDEVLGSLPLRIQKNSKYVQGMCRLI